MEPLEPAARNGDTKEKMAHTGAGTPGTDNTRDGFGLWSPRKFPPLEQS